MLIISAGLADRPIAALVNLVPTLIGCGIMLVALMPLPVAIAPAPDGPSRVRSR